MTVGQRTWFIRIGILAGILLAVILFVSVIRNSGQQQTESPHFQQQTSSSTDVLGSGTVGPSVIPTTRGTTSTSPTDTYLVQLSRIVIERLGSYSNQNDNAHIDDVLSLVTPRMAKYIDTLRLDQSTVYRGQTSRVVTIALQTKEKGRATVVANVQRELDTATSSTRNYPTVRVELVEAAQHTWLVDGIFWE